MQNTVELIQNRALLYLFEPGGSASPSGQEPAAAPTTAISENDRHSALARALSVAQPITLGWKAVTAHLVGSNPYRVQVRVMDCPCGRRGPRPRSRAYCSGCRPAFSATLFRRT